MGRRAFLIKCGKALAVLAGAAYLVACDGSSSPTTPRPNPFNDQFEGTELDPMRWDVFKGAPLVANGALLLQGSSTRADIQSKETFLYGQLEFIIASTNWKSSTENTDSSFGFEVFNGNCHYGAIFVANGHLGLLKPDVSGGCVGDPKFQEYVVIPGWEAVRASGSLEVTLQWSVNKVTLPVRGLSLGTSGQVSSSSDNRAIPDVPLRIRLNADFGESYTVEAVTSAS